MSSSPPMLRQTVCRHLLAVAVLLAPSVARAHTDLRASDPADSSRLAQAPRRITLRFTERPELAFSRIHLVGPAGDVALGALTADTGNAIVAEIPGTLPAGAYRVQWQAAAADGHVSRGELTFVVIGEPDSAVAAVARNPHAPDPAATPDDAKHRTVRWVEFVALLTVVGAFGFVSGVLPPLAVRGVGTADAADRARRLAQSALLLYLAAALLRAYQESVVVHGAERALQRSELVPMLTTTVWGWGWCAGVVGALLVLGGWRLSRRGVGLGSALAVVGVVGMILAPGLSGHAATSRLLPLALAVDALHVAGTGVWLGGLFHVAFAGVPAMKRLPDEQRDGSVAALINSFHPVALFCAPLVVVTGLVASWLRLAHLDALWTTAYGQNLLWKLVMFAFVAMMGAVNWLKIRPRLGERATTRRLPWTLSVELFFATLVLLITAALVSSPVPSAMIGR